MLARHAGEAAAEGVETGDTTSLSLNNSSPSRSRAAAAALQPTTTSNAYLGLVPGLRAARLGLSPSIRYAPSSTVNLDLPEWLSRSSDGDSGV